MRMLAGVGAVLLAVAVAGCGGPDRDTAGPSAPSATSAEQRLVVDVEIAGGAVTPTNATLQAKLNQPIIFRVDSDTDDELHVHSVPEHEFTVQARAGQSFQFTVDVPGSVEVELHHLNRTVATIQVRP